LHLVANACNKVNNDNNVLPLPIVGQTGDQEAITGCKGHSDACSINKRLSTGQQMRLMCRAEVGRTSFLKFFEKGSDVPSIGEVFHGLVIEGLVAAVGQ